MKNKIIKYVVMAKIIKLIAPAVIAALMLLAGIPVAADTATSSAVSLSVMPTSVIESVATGSTETYKITVTTGFALQLDVDGLGQTTAGATSEVEAKDDTSPYTARPWVSIDKTSMQAGAQTDVTITVKIPSDANPGEKYAAIFLHSQPASSGTTIISGIIVPLIFTVNSASFTPNATGEITDLSVPQPYTGASVDILTSFKNIGNSRITNATNTMTIKDGSNNVVWNNTAPVAAPSVLPNYPRVIDTKYNVGLSAGTYTATSEIDLADNITKYSKTITFTVKDPPPVPTAPTLIGPGSSSEPGQVINIDGVLPPTFSWQAVSNVDSYELTISRYPYTTNDTVFYSDPLTGTSFTPPSGTLFDGQKYCWQLTATNVSGTSSASSYYFETSGTAPSTTPGDASTDTGTVTTSGHSGSSSFNMIPVIIGAGVLVGLVIVVMEISRRRRA